MSTLGRSLKRLTHTLGGLPRTLLLFVAMPLVILAALSIRVGFEQANRFQEVVLKTDLELIARAVRIPVGEALTQGDIAAVETALQSVFTIDQVYGASVFDIEGNRVASGGFAETDLTHSSIPRLIETTGEKQEGYRKVYGRTVFSHFLPVFDSYGRGTGFIQITRRHHDFTDALQHLTYVSWGLWGALTVTIIGTVLIGYYSGVGRHVQKLLAAMSQVEGGSLDHRINPEGPREVAALARGFNRMLDGIQQSEEELEQRRTEERRLMLQLIDNEKMAAIGRITRGFAHELGAPLSVIDGRARRMERRQADDSGNLAELKGIRHQVTHLTNTVRGLLEYSRSSTQEKTPVALGALLQEACDIVTAEQDEPGPAIALTTGSSLPLVDGHPDRLLLACLNVLRNAMQAARSRVRVTAEAVDGEIRITVEDDGPGLPQGVDHRRLTEPFFTTRASGEGTGLGLSITQSIASDHGGHLTLANQADGGCRAVLTLPCSPAAGVPDHG